MFKQENMEKVLISVSAIFLLLSSKSLAQQGTIVKGRSCGTQATIVKADKMSEDLSKDHCVFIKSRDSFQEYFQANPRPGEWS